MLYAKVYVSKKTMNGYIYIYIYIYNYRNNKNDKSFSTNLIQPFTRTTLLN